MKKFFTLLWLAIAAFTFKATAQTTSCNANFTAQFVTNTMVKFNPVTTDSPMVQHTWTFGDGSPVSHAVSPTHTFAVGGYAVVHTIVRVGTNGTVICTQSFTLQIVIQECNLVVDFSWTVAAGNPLTYAFQNLSVPLSSTDSITWTFGDNTQSHDVNPTHTYANYGTYNVCLIVKKNVSATASPCIKYICKSITSVAPCTLVVDFNWTVSTTNPYTYEFHNLSTPLSPADSTIWTFGDGTSSTAANPTHTYANAGSYTVCLTVKKMSTVAGAPPCIRYTCKTFTVTSPCTLVVDFSWSSSPTNPLVVAFQNLSTPLAPTDSITWTFGDGTSSHDVSPTHTYTTGGSYNVCLTVKKNNAGTTAPCIRYICKTVGVTTPCNLVVDFSWTATASNPLVVAFHNLSTPLASTDSITWTFGDGTSSHDVNPTHTYTTGGSYNVCLIVKKNNSNAAPCIRYICKTVVVANPCNLVVDFSWTATATNPLMIEFHNLSTPLSPTDSIKWTFGDGGTSMDVNPTHTYANSGTYNVCLIVKKNDNPPGTTPCIRYICKTVVVQAPCTLVANFSWLAATTNAQNIHFTNTSSAANSTDSVRWTFGDGTSSNQYSPDHTYAQPGTYNVCLRMQKRGTNGTVTNCVSEICKTVVVQSSCTFQASWTSHPDSVNTKKIYFTNTTILPTATGTAIWTFGDGTTATSWNAIHEYANAGRYYVCLRVEIAPNCVRYKCDSITVTLPPPPCNNQSNFTVVAASTNSQTFTFTPAYQSSSVQYTWSFGDGTGSSTMIATHHYAQSGTYTACLTVWSSNTCVSTTCKTVVVTSQINCDSIHVSYTYQRDPFIPNKVYFYANANFPILDETWTITKLPAATPPNQVILHTNNPVYVFNDTGYYNVCLRAVTLGGCIKEYCTVIHIEQVPAQCQLTAYPNPASTEVHINVALTAPDMINVYVYNNLNVLVLEKHQQGVVGNNVVTLGIGSLVSGFYTVRLIYGNHYCNSAFQKL